MNKKILVPSMMRVENTNICNEACTICPYDDMGRQKGKMEENLFIKILEEHSKVAKNPRLLFPATVGEPCLDSRLVKWIQIARDQYNYRSIDIITNATKLDKDKAEELLHSGLTSVTFTIHGFSKESHYEITKRDVYDVVVKNILDFIRINRLRGHVASVFLNIYSHFAKEEIKNHPIVTEAREGGAVVTFHQMEQTHNWAGSINSIQGGIIKNNPTKCRRVYHQFGVSWDGTVVPCCVDFEGKLALGNVKTASLSELFNSPPHLDLINNNEAGTIFKKNPCGSCDLRIKDEEIYSMEISN